MNVQLDNKTRDLIFFLSEMEAEGLGSGKIPSLEKRVDTNTFILRIDRNGSGGYIDVHIAKAWQEKSDSSIYKVLVNAKAYSTLLAEQGCGWIYNDGSKWPKIDVIIDEMAAKYMLPKKFKAR